MSPKLNLGEALKCFCVEFGNSKFTLIEILVVSHSLLLSLSVLLTYDTFFIDANLSSAILETQCDNANFTEFINSLRKTFETFPIDTVMVSNSRSQVSNRIPFMATGNSIVG